MVGDEGRRDDVVERHATLQSLSEPGLLHLKVCPDELELILKGGPLALGSPQRVPEHLGKLFDGTVGAARILVNQPGDCVEGVEKKVRIDLSPQRLEVRPARLQ